MSNQEAMDSVMKDEDGEATGIRELLDSLKRLHDEGRAKYAGVEPVSLLVLRELRLIRQALEGFHEHIESINWSLSNIDEHLPGSDE